MVSVHELNLIRKIVGVIGNLTAIFLFLSPTPTFVGIVKKKSVEKYSPIPYLATLMNCLVRLFYGLPMVHPDSTLVITISAIGIVTEIIFLVVFFVYCDRKKQRVMISSVLAVEIVFVAILVALVLTFQHTTDQRTVSVGSVSIVFNIMVYFAPLSVMKMVIKTKSVEFMPFCLSVAGLINASIWTIYGLVPLDPFIAIPNGMGCVLGVAQLILYGIYNKSTKRIMAERQQKLPCYVGEVGSPFETDQSGSEHISSFNKRVNGI